MVESESDVTVDNQRRLTKNEKRRLKKKQTADSNIKKTFGVSIAINRTNLQLEEDDVEVEYVGASLTDIAGIDKKILDELLGVFSKFTKPEELLNKKNDEISTSASRSLDNVEHAGDGELATESANESTKLSKKKKKLMSRLSIAELKQLVPRPDVVEAHDVSSSDPRLLVFLKAYRNTVPVPRHWCHIRKYLQGKRGSEKIPYQLPEFIADTGIAKIREAIMEQEEMKKAKQKARERIRPKMGKIDIDYQVLHDAFFKFQTKPKMSIHGDLYYEGKEFEVQMKEKLPGLLSADLIAALGMQEGSPPPWLINMQRYGPPPSYPNLRIPGLNAPLPPGASYGYQPGGWGKPPVDEYGRPLYGDVFGNSIVTEVDNSNGVDKEFRWGSFEFEEEVNEEDEDLEEEEAGELQPRDHRFDKTGFETPASIDGNSLISGLETPDTIDLRKREGFETPDVLVNRELFHVIQERKISSSGQLFGSERQYVLPGKSDVQLSINPDDLEDMLNNNEKMKDAHDAQALNVQSDILFRHVSNRNASEAEDDKNQGKKRKAEAPLVYKKAKEFKF